MKWYNPHMSLISFITWVKGSEGVQHLSMFQFVLTSIVVSLLANTFITISAILYGNSLAEHRHIDEVIFVLWYVAFSQTVTAFRFFLRTNFIQSVHYRSYVMI